MAVVTVTVSDEVLDPLYVLPFTVLFHVEPASVLTCQVYEPALDADTLNVAVPLLAV
jgi:hypothetical protein